MKKLIATLLMSLSLAPAFAGPRESLLFDDGWKFALGNAADPQKDFGYGTEYFNFWTKAASIHNEGPYSPKFDKSRWGKEWQDVKLPHDWVTELPFDASASHSHGYKTVGPGFPETSVGWYRKSFEIGADELGKAISLRFDGIFHSSQVWVNGFYLGREDDGYVSTEYDISQYLNYGGSNIV
ncbi:MAG: beta-galactosidase, partial [Bacteroidales bacterium]|nr:beta-galactosidase [Bacteroidales bacterium]